MKNIDYKNSNGFPPTICIQLLKWCNLKCKYCRSSSSPFENESLDFQLVQDLLVELSKYGKWRISLTGGEPLYWDKILNLIELIVKLDFPYSITTNGQSSYNAIASIPENYWRNGTLYVSIDGDEKIHDLLRGDGSFKKVINFLEFARTKVKRLYVNTVLFSDPVLWGESLFKILSSIEINNWTIISPVRSGRWSNSLETLRSPLPFVEQFNLIKKIVDSSNGITTTSFLDFSNSDNKYKDVVFIDSNGVITLPGFYESSNVDCSDKPKSEKISLYQHDSSSRIYDSVSHFIEREKYIL